MLIAISSAQSGGKSTLITRLKDIGYTTIERKTSRSILADWGVTLDAINSDPELAMSFQQEILKRKVADDLSACNQSTVITERSPIDLAVYCVLTLGNITKYSNFVDDYVAQCVLECKHYDNIVYIPIGYFKPINDGVRNSSAHFQRVVNLGLCDMLTRFIPSTKILTLDTGDLEQRVEMIESLIATVTA